MMRFTAFVLIFVILCSGLSDATMCQPYSSFKVDCNSCLCSADGKHYSCSNNICQQVDENYDVKLTKDGHWLLLPKNDDTLAALFENNPGVPNEYPYINDEIPSSKEETAIKFEDVDDENEENMVKYDDGNKVTYWVDKRIFSK